MKYEVTNYQSKLSLIDTQIAIKLVKDTFQKELSKELNLLRVSAPLFVEPSTGLNDNLSGVEIPVGFDFKHHKLEIVQSLAKWKRYALNKYNLKEDMGLYTDMNAIRPFEELDNLHSIYVDQWDWEKPIKKEMRTKAYLREIVNKIYHALLITIKEIVKKYPVLKKEMPEEVYFISSSELEKMYPNLTRKEREDAICKMHKAVFLTEIGWPLKDGLPHDDRAADYDDWHLNGDLLVWFDCLNKAFELSSMGIRVDKEALMKQLEHKKELEKMNLMYHQMIINDELPLSIGGGIGQSRLCMFILDKAHIGEVQSSFWDEEEIKRCEKENIKLL